MTRQCNAVYIFLYLEESAVLYQRHHGIVTPHFPLCSVPSDRNSSRGQLIIILGPWGYAPASFPQLAKRFSNQSHTRMLRAQAACVVGAQFPLQGDRVL